MKVVDLFSGAGGFSTGAVQAGAEVVACANHWPEAIRAHAANHPNTRHIVQDLQQFDFRDLPKHDILTASPACQGHSVSRGRERAHHDSARSTAWAVVSSLEACRPKAVVVENVQQMTRWKLFPSWMDAMERLGYRLSINLIDSKYFGVAQSRKRIFMVGFRDRKTPYELRAAQRRGRIVPARTILDFENLGFPTEDQARLALRRPILADATQERIRRGREKFGSTPFWIPYHAGNNTGYSLDNPLWAITTRDDAALINGDYMRMLTVDELKVAMGFPRDYRLSGKIRLDKHMLGNAVVVPCAKAILREIMDAA